MTLSERDMSESKSCPVCNKIFWSVYKQKQNRYRSAKHKNVKFCSDECSAISRKKKQKELTESYKNVHNKPKKCQTPKCKKSVYKQLPDGTEVCRTCLAKHNMYGGVDKPSPTTPHRGKKNSTYPGGFNRTNIRQETVGSVSEQIERKKDLKHRRRKRYFGIARAKGKNIASRAYLDFIKDGGGR
tara:strand:- start:248 stop:802 length:555 start_codon:yes stop_codon:yes gene_type:complete